MTTITIDRATVEQALEALEYHVEQTRPIHRTSEAITALRAALAEPVQEPYAWMAVGGSIWRHKTSEDDVPLYTAPPQRKPLTQEEIPALAEKVLKLSVYYDVWALLGTDGLVALVRAVEAKHGIKESP